MTRTENYHSTSSGVPACTQIRMCVQLDAAIYIFSFNKTHLLKSGHSKIDKNDLIVEMLCAKS